VWGNVWQTNCIARINPATGSVTGWIVLDGLAQRTQAAHSQDGMRMDVLNGIAHDPASGRLFVTGKHWGRLFEIKLVEQEVGLGDALARTRAACIPTVNTGM
jgi:glutaminyl-peptide cyclotransferase